MRIFLLGILSKNLSLIPGCGFDSTKVKPSRNSSELSTTSGKSAGRTGSVSVTMDSANEDATAGSRTGTTGGSSPVPDKTPAPSSLELGSCLVQGETFGTYRFSLAPTIKSSVSKDYCADECNWMMSSAKAAAGSDGCSYSCEWKSKTIVESFSNADSCRVTVATAN